MKRSGSLFGAALLLISVTACGQRQTGGSRSFMVTLGTAWQATHDSRWQDAVKAWEAVTAENPINGEFWRQLATCRYNAGDFLGAIEAHKKTMELGMIEYRSMIPYQIARCYGQLGDTRQAMMWFEKAMKLGYRHIDQARTDPALKALTGSRRFRELTAWVDPKKMSRNEGWRFDLHLLARELVRRRVDPFRSVSQEEFLRKVAQIDRDIPRLSDMQTIIEFSRLTSLMRDGHTCVYTSFTTWPQFDNNLPLQFDWFQEGMFITAADERFKDLLGAKVISFGSAPVDKVLAAIDPLCQHDNGNAVRAMGPIYMRNLPVLEGLGLVADPRRVALTIQDSNGVTQTVAVPADSKVSGRSLWDALPAGWSRLVDVLPGSLPLYLKDPHKDYWFEYLADSKTVYVQWNHVHNNPQDSITAFFDKVYRFVQDHDVDKLAIDMRWNNGGDTWLVPTVMDSLIKDAKINQPGKLFVITSSYRTYSAAQNAAALFERFTKATFVGDGTASSPNFIGEDAELDLPYSGLNASISDQEWKSSYPLDYRSWVPPTLYVPRRFSDYAAKRDACLEAVLGY